MEPYEKHKGIVIPFNRANIDTDAILPKQYLKSIRKTGYGHWLFDGFRYLDEGDIAKRPEDRIPNPDFVLNKKRYQFGSILLAGENFGCGSSREHAPWALRDYGIKVIISSSFADIFYSNCCMNGILPITLEKDHVLELLQEVEANDGYCLAVDLTKNLITLPNARTIYFSIDPAKREQLLNGYDAIDLTLKCKADIERFEGQYRKDAPWTFC
jgi:3-isopropylmalate/(R)-2-methylmalate dehydratase small subunit